MCTETPKVFIFIVFYLGELIDYIRGGRNIQILHTILQKY